MPTDNDKVLSGIEPGSHEPSGQRRKPAHALGLIFLGDDFDAPMPDLEAAFAGDNNEA